MFGRRSRIESYSDRSRTEAPSPTRAQRTVTDAQGVGWHISERPAGHVPGARGPRCLILESEGVCRRLWHYPANWQELSAEELLALSPRG